MKLELGYVKVTDVVLGTESKYEDGVVSIDVEAVRKMILENEKIADVQLDVAKPGESTRITPVKDVIQPRVKVEGPVKYLRQTVVANDGQTLRIKTKRGVWRSMEDVNVYITSPDLTHVSMAGSGEFDAEGMVDTDNLTLELAGSGEIDFKQLVCDNLNIQVAGSGDVDVESVDVNKADMQIAGSGDIKVHFVRADFVSAQVAGSGDIKLSGKAKQVEKKVAGSGSVDTGRLVTQ